MNFCKRLLSIRFHVSRAAILSRSIALRTGETFKTNAHATRGDSAKRDTIFIYTFYTFTEQQSAQNFALISSLIFYMSRRGIYFIYIYKYIYI